MTTTLLENCHIPPPQGVADELSLSLTFFDIPWMHFHPIHRLLFYEFPCSKSHFVETIIPKLKESLTLTLKHYVPLAGNLLFPIDTENNKPIIRYVVGDSVSLKIVESTKDFDYLIGNHARDADQFYDFIPQLPPVKVEIEYKKVPVLALQVSLFPNRGICVGFANHHVLGDASSIVGFIRTWASINILGEDKEFLIASSLPLFDRSVIKDPLGIDNIYWNVMKNKLKDLVLYKNRDLVQVSSFVVVTAYVWTCFVKSGEVVEDDEYFIFAVDCRARIDPIVPCNYFGNCLAYGMAKIGHRELVENEGFVRAVKAIAEDIKNRVNNKDEVLKGAENWLSDLSKFFGVRAIGVSGSPKFDLYNVDFGWGSARKMEVVSIDGEKYSMSLCKSRDHEGGLEVGLSLPKERMETFAAIFADGLRSA
ncbi:hypothetical protein ACJIZ3_006883 [Penstemon smallii]|uniref:Uncharacterized protein n=1 Tax=Penstemon smallii TaxID=265156 RepID=A0ABD3S9G7_9LAMI